MTFARPIRAWLTACGLWFACSTQAAVTDTLPFTGTPDWTDITFQGTSMDVSGDRTVLTTAEGRGVWFGWGAWYGNQPAWTPGTSNQGNQLSITASFSSGAADWHAYLFDRSYYAAIEWNATGCGDPNNCYAFPHENGVRVWHAGDQPGQAGSTFVPLDVTSTHTYEFLLRNGQVSYRIDGNVAYAGAAFASGLGDALLVIGDGSGTTRTGVGAMSITAVSFDTAPTATVLSPVPEPATWSMWLAGLLLAATTAARRSRAAPLQSRQPSPR